MVCCFESVLNFNNRINHKRLQLCVNITYKTEGFSEFLLKTNYAEK